MANLTLTINEDVLRRARIKAIEEHTSVNAVVREFLESYSQADEREQAKQAFLTLARQSRAGRAPSATKGRVWKREDIYEERFARYDPR